MNTFFTDRDLGHQFPEILSNAGIKVELHDSHFGPATPDIDWLKEAGKRGWFVLTHDSRIRYKPNERDAVMRAGVGMFVVVGHASHRELAENFVATRHAVDRFIDRNLRPFIAKLHRPAHGHQLGSRPGSVEMWLSEKDWRRGQRRR